MECPAHDRLVNIDIPVPDFQVEAAIGIGADPSFVSNRCSLTAKIRQGYQVSRAALLAFGEIRLFHEVHLPAEI